MEKTHWKKVFNSDYLGSCDIEQGQDLKAVIKSVSVRKVKNTDGKEQERNVAEFTDKTLKPMILNATNWKIVKKFAKSPYINDWVNIPVQIYVKDDIKAFGDITEGLRIRESQPIMTKPELTPKSPAWPNAVKFIREGHKIEEIKSKYSLSPANEAEIVSQSTLQEA